MYIDIFLIQVFGRMVKVRIDQENRDEHFKRPVNRVLFLCGLEMHVMKLQI